jgi:hypothetical protein
MPFEIIMPELTIENNVTTDMIERIRCYRFKQILKLEIDIVNISLKNYLFSSLLIHSRRNMIRLIDGFKFLS